MIGSGNRAAASSRMARDPNTTGMHTGTGLLGALYQYARLMRLDRPIGIWLLLWPTLWAVWIAGEGRPSGHVFLVMVLGVVVMRSAGCVINDYADRDLDPHVARTRDRPLAARRVTPAEALVLFGGLSLIAIALVLTLNRLTQLLALVGALLTVVYPFMKRFFSAPQLVLGAAFGWGIPMAFAAQTGAVPRLAWLMWLTVVAWAVLYDTMYAMADREDDLRVGVKSTAILFGAADLFIVSLLMLMLLGGLVLIGRSAGLDAWYFGSLGVAAAMLARQRWLIRNREPARCFQAFLNNHYLGAAIFAGVMLDYTFR
jgi:4-hydroxybenzoate polyprenyltransferase